MHVIQNTNFNFFVAKYFLSQYKVTLTLCLLVLAEDDGEEDDEGGGEVAPQYNKLIMPELVISLDATDEFLKERVINLPQAEVEGTHNDEKSEKEKVMFYCV